MAAEGVPDGVDAPGAWATAAEPGAGPLDGAAGPVAATAAAGVAGLLGPVTTVACRIRPTVRGTLGGGAALAVETAGCALA